MCFSYGEGCCRSALLVWEGVEGLDAARFKKPAFCLDIVYMSRFLSQGLPTIRATDLGVPGFSAPELAGFMARFLLAGLVSHESSESRLLAVGGHADSLGQSSWALKVLRRRRTHLESSTGHWTLVWGSSAVPIGQVSRSIVNTVRYGCMFETCRSMRSSECLQLDFRHRRMSTAPLWLRSSLQRPGQ